MDCSYFHTANGYNMHALGMQVDSTNEQLSTLREDNEQLSLHVPMLSAQLADKEMQQQEVDSMKQELSIAYDNLTEAQGRVAELEQSLAELHADVASRTPPGARVNEMVSSDQHHSRKPFMSTG